MFGISYVTFVFCIMYYAPNRLLPGCACYWFTPIRYYQLISCINWPLIPAQNRGSPIPAASSENVQKTATRDRQKLPAQWVWKTAQLGGKTAELATLLMMTKLCWTFMITWWIANRFEKPSVNLEHCFTASTTAHSISCACWFTSCFWDTRRNISQTFWHRLPIFQVDLHCVLYRVATWSWRGHVDELTEVSV